MIGGAGNDTLNGMGGIDTLTGGAGDDTYYVDSTDVVTEATSEGTDIVFSSVNHTLAANVERLTLEGTAISGTGNTLDNVLSGNDVNNTLSAGAGNDWLIGGIGADVLIGSTGDDWYFVDNVGDTATEAASAGTDSVFSSVGYTLLDNVENLLLSGVENLNGTGNASVNTLTGNSGNNILDGKAGADTALGGLGDDLYLVDNVSDVVTENASEGVDAVWSTANLTLANNVENGLLVNGTAATLTGNTLNNWLVGNTNANVIAAGAGDDTLDGGTGADTLTGGAGNDTYYVDNAGDVVTEALDEGTDAVFSTVNYTLTANVEDLTLTGSAITGTGNALNNKITGTSAVNTLVGGLGNDVLDGGAGADILNGGDGDDAYVVDNAGDAITETTGTDVVFTSLTYSLAGKAIENLWLTGTAAVNGTGNTSNNWIIGNNAVNVLTGDAGNDTLNGMGGIDSMIGGLGDDTYYVDDTADVVTEAASAGTDVVYSATNYTLATNVENLVLEGTNSVAGIGNTLNNSLTGNAAVNWMNGAAGDDILDGGASADWLIGGAGNDTFFVDNTDDLLTELAAEGTDLVKSSASNYALAAEVENLTLIGTAAINGKGNLLANTLTGNDASNTLDGLAGADVLAGGLGSDTYAFGRGYGADGITENDATAGTSDLLSFGADIAVDQLWFRHVGNNLEITVIGTSDVVTVNNWYAGAANHVEQFRTSNGSLLLDSAVENLVSAMASLSATPPAQTTLPASYQTSLAPVFAANWH
jgi:Ca2+-binding RTX toxin-like protein